MTTCIVCNRPLTDPNSIDKGMGPICASHKSFEGDIAQRSEFADHFDNAIPFAKAFVMKRAVTPDDAGIERGVITNVPHLVVHHSPTGFEFGYGGSGPADLALNVCQLYLNLVQYSGRKTTCYDGNCWRLAWVLHQDFKRDFIATAPRRGATIPFEKIEAWFSTHLTDELISQCAEFVDTDELDEEVEE